MAANSAYLAPEVRERRSWCDSSRFLENIIQKSGLRKQDEFESSQGYYAFSAAGDYYGSINTHSPDKVLVILERARKEFAAKPPPQVELRETSLGPESQVPEEALVLNVYSRITPLPEGLDELHRRRNGQLGRDHLWLLKGEAAEIVSKLRKAAEAEAPESLSKRLCRYHLTDNVRGESDLWGPGHVKKRSFVVKRIAETETTMTVQITGTYAMLMTGIKVERRDKRSDMGLEGTLEGLFEIDKAQGTWKGATLYASATGWGASTFTPDEPPGRFPVRFAMVVATDPVARQIAPQGVMHSGREEYLAPR